MKLAKTSTATTTTAKVIECLLTISLIYSLLCLLALLVVVFSGIDRQKTCPFMIKLYCRMNGHHRLEEFAPPRFPVDDEVIIYTWRDATLRELSNLVRDVLPTSQANDPTLKFSFTLLYPNPQRSGAFVSRPLGWAFEKGGGGGGGVGEPRGLQLQDSSERTLESFRFLPGDIIDVAVYTNPAMIPRR